jgi:hypothetical protein
VQADFSDLRKLHILTDKLLRLAHILKLNIRLGCQLRSWVLDLKIISSLALQISFNEMQGRLDRYVYEQETSLARIETLIARATGIGQLVSACVHLDYDSAKLPHIGSRYTGFQIKRSEQAHQPRDATIDRTGHQRECADETTHRTVYK